jgi:beta-glucosidase/6-phospho-beta-glucosidase/beta-galactosidase
LANLTFPESFSFGAASAAYQIDKYYIIKEE